MRWLSSRWKLTVMVLPAFAVYSVFIVYSVIYSVYTSFTNDSGLGDPKFVGGANYATMWNDRIFWSSLLNTSIVLVISLVVLVPAAFGLALLLNLRVRGAGTLRALAFAPNIVAPILVGLIWVFILDPKLGLINTVLNAFGVHSHIAWIGGTVLTPYSVSVVFMWQTIGFLMTIFYAGLQMLPADVLEASSLDGASRFQQIRYVVIPMLRGTFTICIVLVVTGALRVFELVYQLTGGGPVHLSEVLVSYMYYVTFSLQHYGQGMALAVVITVLGAIGSLGYILLLRERKTIES